ncbi:Uncharacterized protein C17A5.05c [Hypsizygus marmoreus]|uniref:Uncharacterized protein C17A5.05c n=1 Tax=Hypsizygus marmoreus TaxID=39966 RepID=A0A369JE55_HYPMA|nr:Uncharacterized protein C17A5.05c [Hypsizygus marmoreus]
MSRGDRTVVTGNISTSMRNNYQTLGVSEYYKKVGSTYRNPHFPGIRRCVFLWLNRLWEMDSAVLSTQRRILIFDMACGSGEGTIAAKEWWSLGRRLHEFVVLKSEGEKPTVNLPRSRTKIAPPPLGPGVRQPHIIAADPFTCAAYRDRTSLPCAALSFKEISEGALPPIPSDTEVAGEEAMPGDGARTPIIDIIICSFALHLIEDPSQLFSLLWELSSKARWLVILAPHKKPEIKDGWGWCKWDIDAWQSCRMTDQIRELVNDRVHCRVYRSMNVRQ